MSTLSWVRKRVAKLCGSKECFDFRAKETGAKEVMELAEWGGEKRIEGWGWNGWKERKVEALRAKK